MDLLKLVTSTGTHNDSASASNCKRLQASSKQFMVVLSKLDNKTTDN